MSLVSSCGPRLSGCRDLVGRAEESSGAYPNGHPAPGSWVSRAPFRSQSSGVPGKAVGSAVGARTRRESRETRHRRCWETRSAGQQAPAEPPVSCRSGPRSPSLWTPGVRAGSQGLRAQGWTGDPGVPGAGRGRGAGRALAGPGEVGWRAVLYPSGSWKRLRALFLARLTTKASHPHCLVRARLGPLLTS